MCKHSYHCKEPSPRKSPRSYPSPSDPHRCHTDTGLFPHRRFPFTFEERFELHPAIRAVNCAWRYNRDEKYRFRNRLFDLAFPQCAERNGLRVLPKPQIASELEAQFAADAPSQQRQRFVGMLVVAARIAEEADEFREVHQ